MNFNYDIVILLDKTVYRINYLDNQQLPVYPLNLRCYSSTDNYDTLLSCVTRTLASNPVSVVGINCTTSPRIRMLLRF